MNITSILNSNIADGILPRFIWNCHTYTHTHTHSTHTAHTHTTHTHTLTFSTATDYLWYVLFNDHSTCDTLLHHKRTITYIQHRMICQQKSVRQYCIYNNTRYIFSTKISTKSSLLQALLHMHTRRIGQRNWQSTELVVMVIKLSWQWYRYRPFSYATMCIHGRNKTSASCSEHTTHSSI